MAVIDVSLLDSDQTYNSSNLPEGDTLAITALGNHTLTLDGVDTTVSYDLLNLAAVANVTINAVNDATVTIDNGLLQANALSTFTYGVGDTSNVTVESGTVALSLSTAPTVVFSGAGGGTFIYNDNTLLGSSTTFNVTGFTTGDVIGATEEPFFSSSYSSGTLSLVFRDSAVLNRDTINFNVSMTQEDYNYIVANGGVAAFINASGDFVMPVCFVRGTMIETVDGPVAIEDLKIGDKVIGRSGVREVKWIGFRDYGRASLRTDEQKLRVAPVRVRAGALAQNVPSRDLLVSPWHHLFVSGVLVRANDLVNGTTIVQELDVASVSYWHVELDQFDVVKAHGLFSEAWADGGNRDFFQNVDVTALRPQDSERRMADRPGFKAVRAEKDLRLVRAKVAARAAKLAKAAASKKAVAAA